MSNPANIKKILFVDDNTSFLNMIEKIFSVWNKGSWQFLRASNAAKALPIIEEQMVDLVVIEMDLPGMDAIQFLQLISHRFAIVPKAVLTRKPDPIAKEACLKNGASAYLEKPASMESMESVYAVLNELTKWRPDGGFRGIMWCPTLHEVLQMQCLNQSSSSIEIVSSATRGQIYIQDGRIIHAQADHHKGSMAVAYLLTLKGGEFYLKPFSSPPEVTIEVPWEALLMEAAQTRDEEGTAFFRRQPKKEKMENWEEGIPPLPADGLSIIPQNLPEDLFAPRLLELLVVSPKDGVLLDFECHQKDERQQLLLLIAQQTQDLPAGLGAFDRLEIRDDVERVVARVKPDGRFFARLHRPAEAVAETQFMQKETAV